MKRSVIFILLTAVFFSAPASGQKNFEDSLLKVVQSGNNDVGERRACAMLASYYFKSDLEKCKLFSWETVRLSIDVKDYYRLSAAYSLLLNCHHNLGSLDSALFYLDKLKEILVQDPDNPKTQSNCNQAIGLYLQRKGDFKNALPYALNAVKLAEMDKSDRAYAGGQWLNAADVYRGLADYKAAMDCYFKALSIFETVGNKRGQSFCYTNMAVLYNELGQYGTALKSARISYALKKELNDNRGICTALHAIGFAQMNLKNYSTALVYFDSSLKVGQQEKMLFEQISCYSNIGRVYHLMNKDSLALINIKRSKAIAVQLDNKLAIADADVQLAALNKSRDSLKAAERQLVQSVETFRETGTLEREAENYKQLAVFYEGNKQYDKALAYYRKFQTVTDSISGAAVQVQLKKLEEEYNSVKKENEITVLKKDSELQQQKIRQQQLLIAAAVLVALLALGAIVLLRNRNKLKHKMKELELRNNIAADLHDEVGSSLSSIHMLSQMALGQGNDANRGQILEKMSRNARETMDKMGDIVWMIKPGESEGQNLRQRMESFAYEIAGAGNMQAAISIQGLDELELTMEQRKNIYLIFKEGLNNAVKYSGAEKIQIQSHIENGQWKMTIQDDGSGFDTALVKKGNGLDNLRKRAAELKGQLVLNSSPGKGTLLGLEIPVNG